jgi:hypothetical protein
MISSLDYFSGGDAVGWVSVLGSFCSRSVPVGSTSVNGHAETLGR